MSPVRLATMFHRRGRVEERFHGLYAGCGPSAIPGSICKADLPSGGGRLGFDAYAKDGRGFVALPDIIRPLARDEPGINGVKERNKELTRISSIWMGFPSHLQYTFHLPTKPRSAALNFGRDWRTSSGRVA